MPRKQTSDKISTLASDILTGRKKATAKDQREQDMYDRYTKMSDAYIEQMNQKDS